jgi:hypothetical protein
VPLLYRNKDERFAKLLRESLIYLDPPLRYWQSDIDSRQAWSDCHSGRRIRPDNAENAARHSVDRCPAAAIALVEALRVVLPFMAVLASEA